GLGTGHAHGRQGLELGMTQGHHGGARVSRGVRAQGGDWGGGGRDLRAGDLPFDQDGTDRHQRLHGGRARGLWLDAGRGGGGHAPRGHREPGAPLPAHGHPLLRPFPRHDRHPPRAPSRPLRPCRAEEGLVRRAALGLAAVAALGWPLVAPKYLVFLGTLVAVNAVVAIGLNLLSGYTNQLSFGHAGFLAIGAYVAALVTLQIPALPVPLTLLVAGLATALVGLALGIPCLRLEGLYLAMATLAFGFVVTEAITNLDWQTRGNDGLRVTRALPGTC